MAYEGGGKGEPQVAFIGTSSESIDDAIRAAVDATEGHESTTWVVSHIEVERVGDPNVGSYKVMIAPGGSR